MAKEHRVTKTSRQLSRDRLCDEGNYDVIAQGAMDLIATNTLACTGMPDKEARRVLAIEDWCSRRRVEAGIESGLSGGLSAPALGLQSALC